MADENELKYSERYDGSGNINLQDYVQEALIRIYPYRAVYGGKNKTIIQTGTKTIVRLSQYGIDDFDLANMHSDEEGNKYIDIFAVIDEQTKKTISSGTSTFIQDVRKIKTFTAITNNYIESTDDKPDFFTIGEPFDRIKADSGEQIIYYGSSFTPSYAATKQMVRDDFDIEDDERISEIVLQDVSQLEEQFSKSKLFFRTSSLPLSSVSNITIKTLPNILIDKVKVKGISSELEDSEFIDIDFKATHENMSWFNAIPIQVEDKVEITTTWFDENITLDKAVIENILEKQGDDGFSWSDFCSDEENQIPKSLQELVLDMLLYSYEFNNTFGQVPRTDTGAMVPKYQLGTQKIWVSSIANTTPKDTITGLYRKWKKLNPDLVGGDKEKLTKAFIAAISQEIASDLSVAGGENDFNKNILPWRIRLSESIKPSIDGVVNDDDDSKKQGWINIKDFKFKVDTEPYIKIDGTKENVNGYFKLENNKFVNLSEIDLSESKWIESERRIILPELPETISAIDKINNVGDFSTTSSRDLKYMLKLPLTSDEIDKLFKGEFGVTGDKVIPYSGRALDEKYNAYIESEAADIINKKILSLYKDADKVSIIKAGKDVLIDNREKYSIAADFSSSAAGFWTGIIDNTPTASSTGQKVSRDENFEKWIKQYTLPLTDEQKKEIHDDLGYIVFTSEKPFKHIYWNDDFGGWFGRTGLKGYGGSERYGKSLDDQKLIFRYLIKFYYKIDDLDDVVLDVFKLSDYTRKYAAGWKNFTYSFHIKRHSWQDYEYEFHTNLPSKELVGRKTIYDRPKWKQLIKGIVDPNNGIEREIILEEKYEIGVYEIREIVFSSLFGDTIWINFSNGDEIEVELNQRDDETISKTRIVFY